MYRNGDCAISFCLFRRRLSIFVVRLIWIGLVITPAVDMEVEVAPAAPTWVLSCVTMTTNNSTDNTVSKSTSSQRHTAHFNTCWVGMLSGQYLPNFIQYRDSDVRGRNNPPLCFCPSIIFHLKTKGSPGTISVGLQFGRCSNYCPTDVLDRWLKLQLTRGSSPFSSLSYK